MNLNDFRDFISKDIHEMDSLTNEYVRNMLQGSVWGLFMLLLPINDN